MKRGAIMKQYTLMNKNNKVFDFWYDEEEHLIIKFDYNYPNNLKYAPFGLIKDGIVNKNEINKWWKKDCESLWKRQPINAPSNIIPDVLTFHIKGNNDNELFVCRKLKRL